MFHKRRRSLSLTFVNNHTLFYCIVCMWHGFEYGCAYVCSMYMKFSYKHAYISFKLVYYTCECVYFFFFFLISCSFSENEFIRYSKQSIKRYFSLFQFHFNLQYEQKIFLNENRKIKSQKIVTYISLLFSKII